MRSRVGRRPCRRAGLPLAFAVLLVLTAAGCTRETGGSGAAGQGPPAGSVPVVRPSTAYSPFPYSNPSQRRTFQAFTHCAASHGVDLQGPLADSAGNSLYFRLVPGEKASQAARAKMNRACPQMTAGDFGTPVGTLDAKLFRHAATEFARCIRSHGHPRYPIPDFGASDPVESFWHLPFDWTSIRFTSAVKACVEPLRSYLFPG